jgi:GNAT superfamily N-acetyltransferase
VEFFRIQREELPRWQAELEALEQRSVYPLGDDAFRISHGADYFAFFERLGRVHYYAMAHEGRLIGVACAMLRPAEGELPSRWYVADLKVHPDFRGQHVPLRMLYRGFVPRYLECPRGYAVAMDPPDGRRPPGIRLLDHFSWLPRLGTDYLSLDLFTADADSIDTLLPLLSEAHPGRRLRFVSTLGIKDLVLESTGRPYPLLHLSPSDRPAPRVFERPQPDHVHMWCLPRRHPLVARLAERGVVPSASATVVHHRIPGFDGLSIETAEI